MEKLEIIWSIMGSMGVAFLGLIVWGLKKWITVTFENTVAVQMLTKEMKEVKEAVVDIQRLKKGMSILMDRTEHLKGES